MDLSRSGEVAYRDKEYFGVESRGYDATLRRGVRGRPLGIRDRLRNRRDSRKKGSRGTPVRHDQAGVQRGHVLVTTVKWVRVKMVFACFCFNVIQLGTLAGRS